MPPPKKRVDPPKPKLTEYVETGEIVDWFPGADPCEKPQPCLVTQVGFEDTITGNVFSAFLNDCRPYDGCRHMADKKARVDNSGGGWRHRPFTIAARKLLIEMGALVWVIGPDDQWRLVHSDQVPGEPHNPAV